MHCKPALGILWAVASVFAFSMVTPAQYEHPDLKAGKAKLQSVLILAPQVSLEKSGFKSTDAMMEEAQKIEDALPAVVGGVLKEHGCNVASNPFTREALNNDTDLKYNLADLQKQFDTLDVQLEKKPKDVRKGRFTMGDAVNKVNPGGTADVLVFTRGIGQITTTGKKLFSAIAGVGGGASFLYLKIGVIDARAGTVLYYGRTDYVRGNFVQDPEVLAKSVRKIFKNFPGAASPAGKS